MMGKNKKPVCRVCLMMRFMLFFMAIVGIFLLNGIYQFLN